MGGSYQHNFRPTCLVDGGQTRGSESDLVVLASAVCTALAAKGVDLTGSGLSSRP